MNVKVYGVTFSDLTKGKYFYEECVQLYFNIQISKLESIYAYLHPCIHMVTS